VVFERGAYTSYSACGLPFFVSGVVDDVEDLIARSPAEHRANGIDVRTGHEVVAVDLDTRTVTTRSLDADAAPQQLSFDQLVFAVGAEPIRPDLPNARAASTAFRRSPTASRCATTSTAHVNRRSWWSAAATSASRWPKRCACAISTWCLWIEPASR
jgi:NADPH-dependent 2,4-dienoyl-CoA reductase/sulfur reductase-like enzyme